VSFLENVLETWQQLAPSNIKHFIRKTPDLMAFIIEIETSNYLATIEAYEKAQCLDTSTLELSSKNAIIHSSGVCKTQDEVKRRIGELLKVIES